MHTKHRQAQGGALRKGSVVDVQPFVLHDGRVPLCNLGLAAKVKRNCDAVLCITMHLQAKACLSNNASTAASLGITVLKVSEFVCGTVYSYIDVCVYIYIYMYM